MQVTIIVPDNTVLVNGKPHHVDCSALTIIHAIQWDGTAGVVEFDTVDGNRAPNEAITDISPYQSLIDAWTAIENAPPPPPNLIAYANSRQWFKATSGYTATLNGQQVMFNTSVTSLSLITGKAARFQQPNPPVSVPWQVGPTTFVTILAADFITLATEIADFVQSTFDTLETVLAAIQSGTITTTAGIDQAFA